MSQVGIALPRLRGRAGDALSLRERLGFGPVAQTRTDRLPEEARIADGLRGRRTDALEEAYATYGGAVFGYLVQTLGDRGAAEDVQQQVFLEVWQRGPTYDPARAALFTWIMTIARSRAIDSLRRRVPEPEDPTSHAATSKADAAAEEAPERLADRWHVAQLLRRIPAEEADLLRMRFYREMSQTEIAAETGLPLGTVKMRMIKAFERLREMMEREGLT
jgi:RNA polymerase sigma-70 factor (ECF subfamily)